MCRLSGFGRRLTGRTIHHFRGDTSIELAVTEFTQRINQLLARYAEALFVCDLCGVTRYGATCKMRVEGPRMNAEAHADGKASAQKERDWTRVSRSTRNRCLFSSRGRTARFTDPFTLASFPCECGGWLEPIERGSEGFPPDDGHTSQH